MRRLLAAALLFFCALPACAVRKLSVAELDHLLASLHKPSDSLLTEKISNIQLTERCDTVCLNRFLSLYRGTRTRDALLALAGASAFQLPPAADLPPDPAPPIAEQRRLVKLAADYVLQTVPKLPNFLALRQTVNFEPPPPAGSPIYSPRASYIPPEQTSAPIVTRYTMPVAYRDGQEVADSSSFSNRGHSKGSAHPRRLTTNGEFGPILNILTHDAPWGNIVWSHWERGASGLVAFFSFTVPANRSHFRVDFPCGSADTSHYPAYHGEFGVDPASGAILRLSILATLALPCRPIVTRIVTEFGPVQLGGRTYICPLHSVSISTVPPLGSEPEKTELNDVVFAGYHLFRAETRILLDPGPQL